MKKSILLFAIALFVSFNYATAQKQMDGDKSLEVEFTPWGETPISISKIRLRVFNGDGTGAVRLGLYVGGTTDVTVTSQPGTSGIGPDPDSPELLLTNKTFSFGICPGYEMHFDGTDRLSPYVGAQILFMATSHNDEQELYGSNNYDDPEDYVVWTETWSGGSSTIGFHLLAGADFYFSDNIYLGFEMYFGLESTKWKDDTFEVSDLDAFRIANGIPEDDEVTFDPYINGKHSMWGPTAQGTVRLGVLVK